MSRKYEAYVVVFQHAITNAGVATVPTPVAETGKHFIYSANEITMCVRVAHIYFGSHLTKSDVIEMLVANGLAATTGAGLAIIGTKTGQTVVNELLNFIPVVGWLFKGVLALSITAALGVAFVEICEAADTEPSTSTQQQ